MNKKVHIAKVSLAERSYDIIVHPEAIEELSTYLKPFIRDRKCLIITDSNVNELYGSAVLEKLSGADADIGIAEFPAGEENKNFQTVENLLSKCCEFGLDRSSIIIALGGGVVGDIAGFVASIYMRGIEFIQIPTTLLAMVDSSVGGKTGVDLKEGKNLAGAFWQPKIVVIDPNFLKTLPEREVYCGLAEVIKYGVIIDAELFGRLEENVNNLINLDTCFYSEIITECCRLKAHVVTQDERESGLRAILNYGHTFGHAIEKVTGFAAYAHGEAVAIGMCIAAELAVSLGLFDKLLAERQKELLINLRLPVKAETLEPEVVFKAMSNDKKNVGGTMKLILPEVIGKVSIQKDVDKQLVLDAIAKYC